MAILRAAHAAPLMVVALGLASAVAVDRWAPTPTADVSRGSEDAFASRLFPREIPPRQAPIRWTKPRAVFRFRQLPNGPATVEVKLIEQAAPVAVAADGVVLGVLFPGSGPARLATTIRRGGLDVELRSNGFLAGDGRMLGERLGHVRLDHARRLVPSVGLLFSFVLPGLTLFLLGRLCRLRDGLALAVSAAVLLAQVAALLPSGLVRSLYAGQLALVLMGGGIAAALFGRLVRREASAAAFLALLLAILVQVIAGTSPLMVVSDAVFHGNKLAAVVRGDWFPTSLTQHARPFRIPYGISFYGLLTPLARVGLDPVSVVRWGAGVAGVLASAAFFAVVARHRGPWRALLAVALLQLQPAVFDILSYGNLSNAFGQAMSLCFFAWWAGGAPGGVLTGCVLAALAGSAHLSSFVVLVALVTALALARGRNVYRDRALLAAVIGLGGAALYYASFAPLVAEQLPRLLEGGGQGRGAAPGLLDALRLQMVGALGWGLPVMILAVFGIPRPKRSPLDRDLVAYAAGVGLLVVPALLTPLDVRYLYALTPVLALAAADGSAWLADRRGLPAALGWSCIGAQTVVGFKNLIEAVLLRYR